ncbi:unnamed protein product [Rotaria sp. Silwood1]|nr:unnamed protein product [Rotaria sp. Silwood1]
MFSPVRFSISIDPRTRHTIWSVLIGNSINVLNYYGFNQTQIQRYMCVPSTRTAQHALFINAVGVVLIMILSGFIGIILYAYYADCDPYTAGYIRAVDQIFPYFVMEVLSSKKGLPGVILACIFSGSLSTISSGINSLAAVLIEDVYKGLMQRRLSDERLGYVSKEEKPIEMLKYSSTTRETANLSTSSGLKLEQQTTDGNANLVMKSHEGLPNK